MELSGDTGGNLRTVRDVGSDNACNAQKQGLTCRFVLSVYLDFSERQKLPMQAGWTR